MTQFKSPVLKDFDPTGYHFYGLWKQGLFSICFWVSGWDPELLQKMGIKADRPGIAILQAGNFFVRKTEIENFKNQLYKKTDEKDEAFFEHLIDVANEVFKTTIEYSKTLDGKEPTLENFDEFIKVTRRANFLWYLGAEQFSEASEAKFQEEVIAVKFPAEYVPLIIPKFKTPSTSQHAEIIEIQKLIGTKTLEEIKKDQNLLSKLEDHRQRYAWIEVANFEDRSLTLERLYELITHVKTEAPQEQYKGEIPEKVAIAARCYSHSGYIRQAGAEYFFMLSEKALPFLKKIAAKLGLSYPEFLLIRDVEIRDVLQGTIKIEAVKSLALRRKDMNQVMFMNDDAQVCFSEEAHDIEILKQIMIPKSGGDKELKGQIGNKGKYTGPARIIMNTHDFHKMQAGDVLVSTMTTPDFVVLMHKAGAIVTDIGGMLCHAAIVSREINKPCVIGTKFATQTLKDGDMVEVDADKGIVKILN